MTFLNSLLPSVYIYIYIYRPYLWVKEPLETIHGVLSVLRLTCEALDPGRVTVLDYQSHSITCAGFIFYGDLVIRGDGVCPLWGAGKSSDLELPEEFLHCARCILQALQTSQFGSFGKWVSSLW